MLYWGTSPFSITATDGAAITGETLPGYFGNYDSVGVIDYSPSDPYSANDVLSHSIEVEFDKSLGATSLWYVNGATWTLIADASTDVDAITGKFSYTFPAYTEVLNSGTIVLMGGSLAQAEAPSASIDDFDAVSLAGGVISINWNVDGVMMSTDSINVTICETTDCTTPFETSLGTGNRGYIYSGDQTTHGVVYTVTVEICNEMGCNPTLGSGTVLADSQVDGGAMATDLTINESGTAWTVSWTASGDQSDVAAWRVCYDSETFTSTQTVLNSCVSVLGTSVVIDNSNFPVGTFTYYFAAMPFDELGNNAYVGVMNTIGYERYNDTDSDGVKDNVDAFPLDPTETLDSDNDNVGDNADAFPLNPTETLDSDNDNVGDNADAFPLDPTETLDSDNDNVGDNADAFPNDANETLDSDNDNVGDNADAFPNDANETLDTDGDGVGDNGQLVAENLAAKQAVDDEKAAQKTMMTMLVIVVLLIGGAAGAVLFMRKRGSDDAIANEFIQQADLQLVALQPVQQTYPQPVALQPVQQTDPQPIAQQPMAVAEPSILQQWTDEAGYTWCSMDDGSNYWWTGTEWQKR